MFAESSINETHISQNLARLCDSLLHRQVRQLAVQVQARSGGETYTKEIKSLFKVFFFVGLESSRPRFEFGLDGRNINGLDASACRFDSREDVRGET